MPERLPKTKEYWQAQQLIVGRVGNAALPDYGKADVERPTISDKYELLGFSFYDAFLHRMWVTDFSHPDPDIDRRRQQVASVLVDSAAIYNGYKVMGRLLSYAVRSYTEHCRESWATPELETAVNGLKHPQTQKFLLSWFADTTNEINIVREANFGLHNQPFEHNASAGITSFRWEIDSNSGESYITYEDATYAQAVSEVLALKSDMLEPSPATGCPAHGVLLGNLWEAMVDAAAADPELLPADLAAVRI